MAQILVQDHFIIRSAHIIFACLRFERLSPQDGTAIDVESFTGYTKDK